VTKSSRIRLGLVGATGRMGTTLRQVLQDDPQASADFRIVFTCSGPRDPNFRLLERERPEVLVDFSSPECTVEIAKVAAKLKIPLLICTTGFSAPQRKALDKTLAGAVWAWTPNTSIGVFALGRALRAALEALPGDVTIAITDVHHAAKKDAPSGTALALKTLVEAGSERKVEIHSIRGGTEVGEHRIQILTHGEKLELTHQAGDRSLFAHGALQLAKALLKKRAAGRAYTAEDLFL